MRPKQSYRINRYQTGYDRDHVRIGFQVAQNWVWPYAYDLEDLQAIHARPEFDPDTHLYCFQGEEMVGYLTATITPSDEAGSASAVLDFPRLLPGHEAASERLVQQALQVFNEKGVRRVTGRVTSMCPGDIPLAEKAGFSIFDWGYKVYYSYEMSWGKLDIPTQAVVEIDPRTDLDACASLAALWYHRSLEWCLSQLQQWHAIGLITHSAVREHGKLAAACLAASNLIRPSTAANYYIYTPNEELLIALLAHVIDRCRECGTRNLIADLVNEHRQYEPAYQALGFTKAAEWARCELILE